MRWPRSRAKEQRRQRKAVADRVAAQSKANVRQVESRGPEVDRMVWLLKQYSARDGFADAFEKMMEERGRHGAPGG